MKNIRNIIEQKYPPENPNDLWMKDDVLYKSTHKGWTPLTAGGGSSTNGVTSTTWLELKDKRDAGKLTPGSLYRITDYNCTTTQENTQSAGHQFDIVLLALSENKLAEEGWAMMSESNVYNVTFADGVTKKCYLYGPYDIDGAENYNLVDISTLLGYSEMLSGDFSIEGNTITIVGGTPIDSTDLTEENLTYNYFQNSNLSAWKVWYCLDNDKSRFAWADDSVDDKTIISFEVDGFGKITIPRNESEDAVVGGIQGYAWGYPNENTAYTTSEQPVIGDKVYDILGKEFIELSTIESVSEPTGLPNGRGVIYRLIDEWNNDVAYDFKNIQLYLPIVDGKYVSDGEKTWVYTFCLYNSDEGTYEDGSLKRIEVSVDDTYTVFSNNIMVPDLPVNRYFRIPFNLLLGYYSIKDEDAYSSKECNFFNCNYAIVQHASNVYLYNCKMRDYVVEVRGIYYDTKKVLTES